MKKSPARALCAVLVMLVAAWAATATAAQAADDFLPVDDAFSPSVERVNADHVAVTWSVAEGYYLYRHAFDFAFKDANEARAVKVELPAGDKHTDEFFGEVETYRDRVRAVVPVAGDTPLPAAARVAVTYQGCADAGLCYPPQTRTLDIPAAAGSAGTSDPDISQATGAGNASAGGGFMARQDELAHSLANAGAIPTLGLFFALGVLLAFTPCILPMIPILSGLVVGSGAGPARALVLSLAYVLAMATAYTVFGVIAGYFGANIQALMQRPVILLPFTAVFVLLALASFGAFDLQVPGSWRTRVGAIGTRRGGIAGAAAMGFFAALIAGPCLAPPLVGALLYISSSGDMLLGGTALFMLGLGMGLPLIAIGTLGARVLPRAGTWMIQVRVFFGVLLLAVAIWLLSRLLDPVTALAAWGMLALSYGAYLSTHRATATATRTVQRAVVFLLFVYAGAAAVGVLVGDGRATRPLSGLVVADTGAAAAESEPSAFTRVPDIKALRAALDKAARANRPAVVDFYADWCVECVHMEHTVFAKKRVRQALEQVTALQVDVTDYDSSDRKLLKQMNVYGPPTLLFYRPSGKEASDKRLVGAVDAAGFIRHLQRATAPATAS